MATNFELCEGISLKIKAKELSDWEKETAEIKNLDEDEHKIFKTAIQSLGSTGTRISRKDIVALVEEIRKPKKPKKIRHSGHFLDQKLKYEDPNKKSSILLSEETKRKVGEEIRTEGIKLSPTQDKLINALMKLLHEKSENKEH